MVELVPELLLPCLEEGLVGESKMEAYKLVINAYLFDYLPELADSTMADFLADFPQYREAPDDQAEFVQLLRTHRSRQEAVVDETVTEVEETRPDPDPVETETPPVRDREPSITVAGQAMTGLGVYAGTNITRPQLIEPFSTADPLAVEEGYSMAFPGFLLGATFTLPLSRSIETGINLHYNRTRINYADTPFTFTSYEYTEKQNRFQVPVTMNFILNPGKRSNVYLSVGLVPDLVISSNASATRTYTNTSSSVLLEKVDVSSSRKKMNLYGTTGMGIRTHFTESYFFVELRYQGGLFQDNKESFRYSNQEMVWMIYHVDSDFRIHQLNISAGLVWSFR